MIEKIRIFLADDHTVLREATVELIDHQPDMVVVGQAGQNMAILNNLVIGLCLRRQLQNLAQARRHFCARPDKALKLILAAQ